jgi:hypothetical protein
LATSEQAAAPRLAASKLSVSELLRSGAASYVERYAQQAVPQVQSTLAKLSLCRTAELGERTYHCQSCEQSCVVYNSCGGYNGFRKQVTTSFNFSKPP